MFTLKSAIAATAVFITAGAANAAFIDFETGYSGNVTSLGNNASFPTEGITFSSANGLNVVKVGGNADGFVPNDTPDPSDAFGDYFLTSDFGTTTSLSINYVTAVSEASFDVADIDGSGNDLEEFTFKAFDAGSNLLASIFFDGNDPLAGNRQVTRIGFSGLSGLISSIEITGTTSGGSRLIGIAFDNFNTDTDTTAPIPLPAGLPLLLTGIGGLAWLRRRQKGAAQA